MDGLERFQSIHPSLLPGDLASPIVTSTQEPLKRKSNSSWSEMSAVKRKKKCQTEKDILGATSIALITSASEDENQAIKEIEYTAEKRSLIQAEMKQPEGQKDQNCPESFGFVFQKVPKNLRDQRLQKNGLQKKLLSDNETRNKMQAKLSGQPWKMSKAVQNPNVTAQFQTECYPHIHTDVESKISKKKQFSHDDSASPKTDKERNRRPNQYHSVCDDGSLIKQTFLGDMEDSRSKVIACFTSKELYKDQYKLTDNKTIGRLKRKDDTENMSQRQRSRVNSGDATCIPSSKTHNSISNLEPFKTDHTKFTVTTSTLNKLKRFSFLHNTENTTGPPRGDLKGKTKKSITQGTESSSKEMLNYNERQVNPTPSNHNKNAVSVNKRKCFDLGPLPCSVVGSRGTFSGLSLFDSVELGNDVLNTDWDQESAKTDKI